MRPLRTFLVGVVGCLFALGVLRGIGMLYIRLVLREPLWTFSEPNLGVFALAMGAAICGVIVIIFMVGSVIESGIGRWIKWIDRGPAASRGKKESK